MTATTRLRDVLGVLALAMVVVGAVNLVTFLGSDAPNSYERDGRYYVGRPGRFREVTRQEWESHRFRARSVFVTQGLAILSGGYLMMRYAVPFLIGQAKPDTSERVDRVRASGCCIASASCSGSIGMVHLRGRLLHVSVFPLGLVIKPILTEPRAILARELIAIHPGRLLFRHRIVIHHAAPDLRSPITLYVAVDSPLAEALRDLIVGRPSPVDTG